MCSLTLENVYFLFFFSSRRRHTRFDCDWSSDVCSSDLERRRAAGLLPGKSCRVQGAADHRVPGRLAKERCAEEDRKSTRLNSSHSQISYAVFCLKKKKHKHTRTQIPLILYTRRPYQRFA